MKKWVMVALWVLTLSLLLSKTIYSKEFTEYSKNNTVLTDSENIQVDLFDKHNRVLTKQEERVNDLVTVVLLCIALVMVYVPSNPTESVAHSLKKYFTNKT